MKLVILPCVLSIVLVAGAARADAICDKLVAALPNLKQSAGTDLAVSTIAGKTYKQLFDDCDANDKFAGQPLPNKNKCSTDKNSVQFLKVFTGDSGKTVVFRAKAAVDVDGSPASNLGNPNDQTSTSLFFDEGSKDKTANAEEVPFVVIPQESFKSTPTHKHIFYNTFFGRDTGAKTGDLAIAVHDTFCSFGVVGDTGPEFRLGENGEKDHPGDRSFFPTRKRRNAIVLMRQSTCALIAVRSKRRISLLYSHSPTRKEIPYDPFQKLDLD